MGLERYCNAGLTKLASSSRNLWVAVVHRSQQNWYSQQIRWCSQQPTPRHQTVPRHRVGATVGHCWKRLGPERLLPTVGNECDLLFVPTQPAGTGTGTGTGACTLYLLFQLKILRVLSRRAARRDLGVCMSVTPLGIRPSLVV